MKKNHLIAKFIFLILLFAGGAVFSQETEKTVINIENARNTKYEKDKSTGNDLIILTGNVKVSVSRGSTKNVISADSIRYDRTSEMMYAEGNVSLEQTTANAGSQNVSASSLMFNTSTLEGVFDDGRVVQVKSDAINLPAGSTLIVASDIFGRSESNTITFKNGELTFCDDEDPHWRIKASRIWLLPGGEFAFLNARLFVGPVPIFYLPAFYYPKDELIFNPVFGYEKRRGYFIETTSYLYGRKPLETTSNTSSTDSDSSEKLKALFNFVKPSSLKEQRIEGLMMHNLDDDYKGNTTNYFKILGDYYSNLGFLVGFDGVFKPKKYISSLEMSANLGFSNTIFKDSSGNYLPFSPGGDRIYDKSNLLGFELPFRYSGKFKMSMSSPFTLNISLPVYSDPYFSNDFTKDRSETMDWISFLIDSQNTDEDNTTTTTDSSFNWTVSGSYSVPLPQVIKPFLNSMSLSLNSSVAFSSISIKSEKLENSKVDSSSLSAWKSSTPERMFFYPSQVIPMSLSGTISGTLIDISTSKTKTASKNKKDVSFAVPMITPDDILPLNERKNKEKTETESQNSENQNENAENGENNAPDVAENETEPLLPDSALPVLTGISANVTDFSGISYSMKYSIKPSLSTQISYNSSNLDTPGDFDWSVLKSSMYKLSVPITLDNNFSYSGSFFSISNSNTFNPVRQRHPYLHMNEKDESGNEIEKIWYSDPSAKSIKKADYGTDKLDLTQTNSVALKPFNYIKFIKDTGITWRSSIKLVRTEFLSDEYEKTGETEWDYHFVDWTDENSITTNALDFTFATNQMDSKFFTEPYAFNNFKTFG